MPRPAFPSQDLALYTLSRAVPGLGAFVGTILYTRVLGSEDYALYSMAINLVMTVSALGFAWLNQGQLRFRSLYTGERQEVYSAALARSSILAIVATVAIAPAVCFITFRGTSASGLGASFLVTVATALFGVHMFNITKYQAELRPREFAWNESRRATLILFIPLLFVALFGAGQWQMLSGFCLGVAPALWRYARDQSHVRTTSVGLAVQRELWRFGWPIAMWIALLTGLPLVERFLVLQLLGVDALGHYVPFYDLVFRSYTLFLMPITLAYHPRIMVEYNRNDGAGQATAHRHLATGLGLQLAVGLVVIVLATIESDFIAHILGVRGDLGIRWTVAGLATAGLVWQLSQLVHKPLEARGKPRVMLAYLAVSLAVLVAIDVAFLPCYGVHAAVLGNLVAAFLYCGLCLADIARHRNRSVRSSQL